ncbi:MAG TPA: sulfur carrier protein ThiS adenylyltransferase ThiF [Bacteroidales bacterium]|nr:sulfur carrier protein ThiS adenylyltransferase ThiF [Bacteroidales bacterium]HQQ12609.1 sulfur carrier protein ThiS adenylyltransferase ThiF [Bacteroidales bacterium]
MDFETIKDSLNKKTVGIAGCGGLGSNVAASLTRVGIGKLVLADFDNVEPTNLNRQFYFHNQLGMRKVDALTINLRAINPHIELITFPGLISETEVPALFGKCDCVIEAFDKAEAKVMLVETMMDKLPHKPLIVGSGMAGIGGFDQIKLFKWTNNIYVCGDLVSEISKELPPISPKVNIVANLMADLALQLLLGLDTGLD